MANYTLNDTSRGLKWGNVNYTTAGGTVQYSFASVNLSGAAYSFLQLTPLMQEETKKAFATWSSAANITFQLVADSQTTNTGGIRIGGARLDGAGGVEGETRRITNSDATIKAAQIAIDEAEGWQTIDGKLYDGMGNSFYHIMLHEIGHALGLNHFDGEVAVMNTVANADDQLHQSDIDGIQFIYGAKGSAPDLYATGEGLSAYILSSGQPVYVNGRVGNQGNASGPARNVGYYLSTDATITTADRFLGQITINDYFSPQTSGGYATQVTIPTGMKSGNYFLGFIADIGNQTAESNEGNNASKGTLFTINNQTSGQANLAYRFFDTQTKDHFYTLSAQEAGIILSNTSGPMLYEGAQWATPNKSSSTQDVFRFYDTAKGDHFYTTSAQERDIIIRSASSYRYEGLGFQAYTGLGAADALPLERFYNTISGLHHFSVSAGENAFILSGQAGPGWVDEGRGLIVSSY